MSNLTIGLIIADLVIMGIIALVMKANIPPKKATSYAHDNNADLDEISEQSPAEAPQSPKVKALREASSQSYRLNLMLIKSVLEMYSRAYSDNTEDHHEHASG